MVSRCRGSVAVCPSLVATVFWRSTRRQGSALTSSHGARQLESGSVSLSGDSYPPKWVIYEIKAWEKAYQASSFAIRTDGLSQGRHSGWSSTCCNLEEALRVRQRRPLRLPMGCWEPPSWWWWWWSPTQIAKISIRGPERRQLDVVGCSAEWEMEDFIDRHLNLGVVVGSFSIYKFEAQAVNFVLTKWSSKL